MAKLIQTPDIHVSIGVDQRYYLIPEYLNFRMDTDQVAWDFDNVKGPGIDYSNSDYFWLDSERAYDVYLDMDNTKEDRYIKIYVTGYDFVPNKETTTTDIYIDAYGTGSKPTSYTGWKGLDVMFGSRRNETFHALAGKDVIVAGSGDDKLYGEAGNDRLHGGSGNDRLYGGENNDVLFGDSGNDKLSGSSGNDTLIGGLGTDILTGGSGADTFDFNKVTESTVSTSGRDTVTGFSHGQHDVFDLKGIDADTTRKGNNAFEFIGSHGFTGDAGELRAVVRDGLTFVYGDINGDKKSDFGFEIDHVIKLVESDFHL